MNNNCLQRKFYVCPDCKRYGKKCPMCADIKKDIETFEEKKNNKGGFIGGHTFFVLLALFIFLYRMRNGFDIHKLITEDNSKICKSNNDLLSLFVVLCCPYCYLIYVVIDMVIGIDCDDDRK
jgi:hypothetical protein